jgi:hypothetical protein
MLEMLASVQARALAEKARAARESLDRMLAGVRETQLAEPRPLRGEHDPLADLGFDALPEDDPHRRALFEALSAMPLRALRELWALVLIGRGDYALKDWPQALSDAMQLPVIDPGLFMEQVDLHEYLMKAVYELERTYGVES